MLKLTLVLVLFYCCKVQGYGYRYNFNIGTGQTNLWTFLPGHTQPIVYEYNYPGQPWPQIYSVPYDGLLPGDPVIVPSQYHGPDDPALYRYRGPDGKYRFKCKPDAYYSEFAKKCLWKASHFTKKNRPNQG